jgi:hypothetical protein
MFKNRSRPVNHVGVGTALVLLCLALTACGGSSSNSSSASSTAAAGTGAAGAGSGRFAALRTCLQKQGITLPQRTGRPRTPGAGGPGAGGEGAGGGGGFFGGGAGGGAVGGAGPRLPAGVTLAQYQAALRKCGGGSGFGTRRNFNSTANRTALTKYAACLRTNGISLPAPNFSGTGPVFNTKGINTTSAAFTTAETRCKADLPQTFRGGNQGPRPGGAGAPVPSA